MRTVVSHEITGPEPHSGYLIVQRGLPEIEEFILSQTQEDPQRRGI
jgi:hypothetical protein